MLLEGVADENGLACRNDGGGAEDVEMGKCMENLGVVAADSRSLEAGRGSSPTPSHTFGRETRGEEDRIRYKKGRTGKDKVYS